MRTFELEPDGFVDYKYRLEAGQAMLYSWTASSWVRSEMHSEADTSPIGTAEFFEVVEETLHRHGSYVAPFDGIHGWYGLTNRRPGHRDRERRRLLHHVYRVSGRGGPHREEITETPDSTAYRPYF